MVSYNEAGRMLDKCMEALPEGIFRDLNGGVNLLQEAKVSEKGGYILGLYHNNFMGRYIEIFYGSFVELYGDIPPMQFERRLRSTLHHELTHHIEGLAGDRSLEHWDEAQDAIWGELEEGEMRFTGSILFIDDDDTAFAPAAKALFRLYAADRCPDIPAESAGLFASGTALQPDCAKAAEALGADFSSHSFKTVDEELFEAYDTVLCMTLAQVDELLDRFPGSEDKLQCMDETDILRPRLRMNWKKCVERVRAVVDDISRQLCLEGGESAAPDRVQIVRVTEEDIPRYLPAIARLERQNFSLPMSEAQLQSYMKKDECLFYAAVRGGEVLGYIGGMVVLDKLEIFNVAVDESCRRQHIGEALVGSMLAAASPLKKAQSLERITLEVRAGNVPAIALYEKQGFTEVGRRKNYYEKPREDAILMDCPVED